MSEREPQPEPNDLKESPSPTISPSAGTPTAASSGSTASGGGESWRTVSPPPTLRISPQSSSSDRERNGLAAKRFGIKVENNVILAPRQCPGCGELMSEGTIVRDPRGQEHYAYRHEAKCRPALELLEQASATAMRESLKAQYLHPSESGLPPAVRALVDTRDWLEIDGLVAYRRAFAGSLETPASSHFRALGLATRFVIAISSGRVPAAGLALQGPVGTGKSTLLSALARDVIRAYVDSGLPTGGRPPLLWCHTTRLKERLQDQFNRHGEERLLEQVQRLIRVPVLVLDNLGGEDPSPWWVNQILFGIFSERYEHRRPVLVTTKYTQEALRLRWGSATRDGKRAESAEDILSRMDERLVWQPLQCESFRTLQVDF